MSDDQNNSGKELPYFLTPEGRKKTSRKRHITRSTRAFIAILIALVAGFYLVTCSIFKKPKHKKSKTDKKEHRKGMPVRDNIVE